MPSNYRDATESLLAHVGGEAKAQEQLSETLYMELRRLAAWHLSRDGPGHTLQPTDLAHGAYLRLIDDRKVDMKARSQFMALAARQMRRILIDHHRRKNYGEAIRRHQ
jgi:hypothetical protein